MAALSLLGFVTDFDFSPFHDSVLVTGAEDGVVSYYGYDPVQYLWQFAG